MSGRDLASHDHTDTAAPTIRLAIVIPVIDEAPSLKAHLPSALAVADEVIVADGGSLDASVERARQLGARVVQGPAGRGLQLNHGAAATDCEALLFLHADSVLPQGAAAAVRHAIADGAVGGGFYLSFDSTRRLMRLGSRLVNLRTRWLHVPLGDQAQFVRRDVFLALGGFRPWPILEDLDFILRLHRHGPTTMIPLPVSTAARRFERQGILRTVATNWLIWTLYALGVPPRRLQRLYRQVR